MNSKRQELAKRVLANTQYFYDLDMTNPFPPPTPMEDMEDAASGKHETLPVKTLRGRPYGVMPLALRPEYSGDFLDRLRKNIENKVAFGSPDNIYDYSMPSELLKHQETPMPNDMKDDFYEFTHMDESGYKILQDYWDRGWDENDAPEFSDDKVNRLRKCPDLARRVAQSFSHKYLLDIYGINMSLDTGMVKTAMLLSDLQKSEISGKDGYKKLEKSGNVLLFRAEPKEARWTFTTGDHGNRYFTVLQFIRQGNVRDPSKLHVRVMCTCPSWLYYGAQYNAFRNDYLYGKLRPKLVKPEKKDQSGKFLCCKHVLACIELVLREHRYKIQISERYKKPKSEPDFQVQEIPVPRIPADFQKFLEDPVMKSVDKNWNKWTVKKRKEFIAKLEDPDAVVYMSYRFPDTSSAYAHERLVEMSKMMGRPEVQTRSMELLGKSKPFRMPDRLKGIANKPEIVNIERNWESWNTARRKKAINGLEDEDDLEYMAHRYPESATELIAYRLKELINRAPTPEKKAEYQELSEKLV